MRRLCGAPEYCAAIDAAEAAYDSRWSGMWGNPSRLVEWVQTYPLEAAIVLIPFVLMLACIAGLAVVEIRRRREEDEKRLPVLRKLSLLLTISAVWMLVFPILCSTQPYMDAVSSSPDVVNVQIQKAGK